MKTKARSPRVRSPRARSRLAPAAAVVLAGMLTAPTLLADAPPLHADTQTLSSCSGEPCDAVFRGFLRFFDRRLHGLGGNGRSCADCHMPTNQFQLSPAAADARFKLLQWRRRFDNQADDPLFRPIDANDFRTNGENASNFSNLRENGLVRITFPLPPNIRLIDAATNAPSTETVADVWRMVPTVNEVAITGPDPTGANPWPRGPNPAGGYQLDGRFATLQEQALGALVNHAQIDHAPPQQFLDDLAAFQRTLFTNRRVRALAEAMAAGVSPLPDTDPPLTALQQQGKVVFERACAHCHAGPNHTTPKPPIVRYGDIVTQCPRPIDTASPPRFVFKACPARLARNARTYEITLLDGSRVRRTSSDPGRALLTGFVGGPPPSDDWNKLDVPPLFGMSKTAPYFHNNSADTLDEVFDHYVAFFQRAEVISRAQGVVLPVASTNGVTFDRIPLPAERKALLAYLRRL
jgi:cytochrome c peroxidase